MKAVAEQELIDLAVRWVKENGHNGSDHMEITEHTNLLESGLLDSFAFVDLVLFIENHTGNKLDLIDVDPEQFTVVRNLCHLALRNGH
ncbi:MAG TPA: acyl carrier protein [Candidatus Acidoferrum sp.]|nr:acyl carrier protein [Candidatus Acidoferrum sp.]